jgi:hypothetical protein
MTSRPEPLSEVRLAVDCMGGDHGPSVTLPACKAFLDRHPDASLILVGTEEALRPAAQWPRVTCLAATEVVTMDDPVEVALRKKRNSSMRVAIAQVKPTDDGQRAADACVSAGNTGALMAVARYVLKTLDGIDRPAIATVMPNRQGGFTTVLDLGANVDCSAEHLLQFALMGSALVAAVEGREDPSRKTLTPTGTAEQGVDARPMQVDMIAEVAGTEEVIRPGGQGAGPGPVQKRISCEQFSVPQRDAELFHQHRGSCVQRPSHTVGRQQSQFVSRRREPEDAPINSEKPPNHPGQTQAGKRRLESQK